MEHLPDRSNSRGLVEMDLLLSRQVYAALKKDMFSNRNHSEYSTAGLKRFLGALCVVLSLSAFMNTAKAADAQAPYGLNFAVVAPERKADGRYWDSPGNTPRGYLPDIFVCLRATEKRWDCAQNCQDSRSCWGTLKIQGYTSLTIGVFDRDLQRNDPMYKFKEIKSPGKCNPCILQYDDGSIMLYKTDEANSWARIGSRYGCPSPFADPTAGNWCQRWERLQELCKTESSGICKIAATEQEFATIEVNNLSKNELDNLPLECRIGYLERLGANPKDSARRTESEIIDAASALYLSNRGIYKDPDLATHKASYDAIAEELRGYLDRLANADPDNWQNVNLLNRAQDREAIPDLVLSELGRDTSHYRYAVDVSLEFCPANAVVDPRQNVDQFPIRRIVICENSFAQKKIVEQIYILIEEAYHLHQFKMSDEYCSNEYESDKYKLYAINHRHIVPGPKDLLSFEFMQAFIASSYYKWEKGYGSDSYYDQGLITSAYHNQPMEYNAKLVAGYIVGRAICYKDQKKNPIDGDDNGSTFGLQCQ
jgi:hypothetical protein